MRLGVIFVISKNNQEAAGKGMSAVELMKNRAVLAGLAGSDDTQRLMTMLQKQGGVQQAAKAAAAGDPSHLMSMVEQLMCSKEGADLVARIQQQARKAGVE